MTRFFDQSKPDFADAFEALLRAKRETTPNVEAAVGKIIADVIAHGDNALVELTRRFDRFEITASTLRIPSRIACCRKSGVVSITTLRSP